MSSRQPMLASNCENYIRHFMPDMSLEQLKVSWSHTPRRLTVPTHVRWSAERRSCRPRKTATCHMRTVSRE